MNNDDVFFSRNPPQNQPIKGLYEIFLAYFNEDLGHIPLFTYPIHLKKDKDECRIISIHSIWWLDTETQHDLEHVDLEYSGRNYLATKFKGKSIREKARSGLKTETPEVFVLITSVPINYTQFGINMLKTLFQKMQSIKDELYVLIKKEIACEKIIKNQQDRDTMKKGEAIEAKLLKLCEESIPDITPDILNTLVKVDNKDQENLAYLLLEDLHMVEPEARSFEVPEEKIKKPITSESEVFKHKIEITNISIIDPDQKLKITVKNVSNRNLEKVQIRITHLQEFFEAASWSTTIDEWFQGEELIFQYPRILGENNDEYMLRIEDPSGKLLVKKISPNNFKSGGNTEE